MNLAQPTDPSAPPLTAEEAELARQAQRCIMAALDHSRAATLQLVPDDSASAGGTESIALPPRTLRTIAQVLGLMAQGQPVLLVPQDHEYTTMQAAAFLKVSRPFVIKEIEAGRLVCRKVGSHRRIAYRDLVAYRDAMRRQQEGALQDLADLSQDLDLGY